MKNSNEMTELTGSIKIVSVASDKVAHSDNIKSDLYPLWVFHKGCNLYLGTLQLN